MVILHEYTISDKARIVHWIMYILKKSHTDQLSFAQNNYLQKFYALQKHRQPTIHVSGGQAKEIVITKYLRKL